ncbi:hypothetical protein N7510_005166 [Penicillium lagena]|uniref:uncharacterized protein n=1 Tax=Penicillium lagena TaxID=94218 RepID=UPI00253FE6AC|nr:uncharacterized protein N7510_005166 [Penicillium lagena]KAJ5611972.1 hypothetical protein N7510_005166 [Penicillium lagena]
MTNHFPCSQPLPTASTSSPARGACNFSVSQEVAHRLPNSKILATGSGITLEVALLEPFIYLRHFDIPKYGTKSPAIVRGQLYLKLTKNSKMKSIRVCFKGRAGVDWPGGKHKTGISQYYILIILYNIDIPQNDKIITDEISFTSADLNALDSANLDMTYHQNYLRADIHSPRSEADIAIAPPTAFLLGNQIPISVTLVPLKPVSCTQIKVHVTEKTQHLAAKRTLGKNTTEKDILLFDTLSESKRAKANYLLPPYTQTDPVRIVAQRELLYCKCPKVCYENNADNLVQYGDSQQDSFIKRHDTQAKVQSYRR